MSQLVAANYITARENSLKILHTQADNLVATRVPKQNALRNGAQWLVMLAIFAMLVHCWLVEAYVVSSGSMAPTLLGQHRRVTCSDCGLPLDVGSQADSEPLWTEARAICPNCGAADNPLADLPDTPGDGLLVFRGAFNWRAPRRWEPVVFRGDDDSREPVVKRVVGLPGETIQLVDGNVIVDGTIARKPLAVQRAVAILVNDDRYRPGAAQLSGGAVEGTVESADLGANESAVQSAVEIKVTSRSCWRPRDEHNSAWTLEPGEFRYRLPANPESTPPRAIDWIDFHPRQRLGAPQKFLGASENSGEATSAGVDDHYAYNQSRPILELHPVHELLLRCELTASGTGQLALRAVDRDHEYEVRIELPSGAARLLVDGQILDETKVIVGPLADEVTCEISTIDRQFLCAIDGQLLFPPFELPENLPINSEAAPRRSTEGWFSIGANGANVDVRSAQVLRDIYYTRLPTGFSNRTHTADTWHVGEDTLFVLGDNSPFSQDSRVTAEPGVPMSRLIGRPLVVHAPRRAFTWRGRQWNLLDLSRIRAVR